MAGLITYLHLLPNFDKTIIDILESKTLQILNQNQLFSYTDSIDDLKLEINNNSLFKVCNNIDPINEINIFFAL